MRIPSHRRNAIMLKWFDEKGDYDDVVIATRVRLSRNLTRYPFSTKMSDEDAKKLVDEVTKVGMEGNVLQGKVLLCNLAEMNETNRIALVERNIITPYMVNRKQSTGLLMNESESANIMINEDDHIRIQTLSGGLRIFDTYKRADAIDDALSDKLDIAFDEKYGYLTTCPTNVGTGLRVSCLLFLPALSAAEKINALVSEISKYGVTLKAFYGDSKESQTGIFQVTNQKTLGCSEQEIIDNLNTIVLQIIKQERVRREYVITRNFYAIEDQVYRSYGILKYTKQIDCKNAVMLLAQIMLGVKTGIIKLKEEENIYKMIMNVQPHVLQATYGKNVGTVARERLRADYINKNLPELITKEETKKGN